MKMFERNIKHLKEGLDILKKENFDSLHLPGGQSPDGKHACFGFFLSKNPNPIIKEIYLFVNPYKSLFHKMEKITQSDKKETPKQTLIRELEEEMGVHFNANNFKLIEKIHIDDNREDNEVSKIQVISEDIKHKKVKNKFTHIKYFYLYEKELTDSQIRKISSYIPDENTDEISQGFFLRTDFVKRLLFWKHYAVLKQLKYQRC